MKLNPDDVAKTFNGLAIAASRANGLAKEFGKDKLLSKLPRRQQDSIRQHLLEIESDVQSLLKIMTKG